MAELSSNARKQQEDDIERLVKCRVRSEIEARKAAEATMKRAVHEARELKKELMIMRQEKEELKAESKKIVLTAATTPAPVVTKDDLQKKLNQEKTKRKELSTQLAQTQRELENAREQSDFHAAELTKQQRQSQDSTQRLQDEVQRRQKECEAQVDEIKKHKAAADEAKRKYQRVAKDKKEELQQLVDENAQLTKRCESLERLTDENVKLRRQLDKAKSHKGGVADEWQRKLDQREQAFLRQEQDNKRLVVEKQAEIESLAAERDALSEKIHELESDAVEMKKDFESRLQQEQARYQDLVTATKQLQERLLTLKEGGRAADKARLEAEARLVREVEMREAAEAAADAVESRTLKLEGQLQVAQDQLERIERALKSKGITLDYLLQHHGSSTTGSGNSHPRTETRRVKEHYEAGPEEPETLTPNSKEPRGTAKPKAAPVMSKSSTKTSLAMDTKPIKATIAGVKPLLTKSKVATARHSNQADREPTPERMRK